MTFNRLLLTFAALLVVSLFAFHQVALAVEVNDGSVVESVPYSFPPYEKALQNTNIEGNASKEEYERAIQDDEFEFQKLKYMSDGLKVTAYLYKPVRTGERKFPVVIFNRGSVVRNDIAPELVSLFHRLSTAGFVVLAPMYRQSDGGEGRDEVGGGDINDLMNVALLAKSLGFIDLSNMFLYGESRGGMMTYLAMKKSFPANAAAVYGAFTDMETLIKDRPQVYPPQVLKQIWPEFESRKEEILRSRSAIYWPESLGVPVLIMHGGADWSVNPSHSLTMAQKLQGLGKTYELVVYAGDNHILSANREDRDRRVIAWFKKHLKPKP
jgi:dipeptidyl aminopeptidase/acylaminoacyl peptidase